MSTMDEDEDAQMLADLGSLGTDYQPADEMLSWLLVNADAINPNEELPSVSKMAASNSSSTSANPPPNLSAPGMTSRLLGGFPQQNFQTEQQNHVSIPTTSGPIPSTSFVPTTSSTTMSSAAPTPMQVYHPTSHSMQGNVMPHRPPQPAVLTTSSSTRLMVPHGGVMLPGNTGGLSSQGVGGGGGGSGGGIFYTDGLRHPHMPAYVAPGPGQPPLAFQPAQISQGGGGPAFLNPFMAGHRPRPDGTGGMIRVASNVSGSFVLSDSESVSLGTPMPRTDSMESFLTVATSDNSDDDSAGNSGGQHDKKKRRLQKNRESARECRRRQRAHAEELAARVQALQTENRHLQQHLQTVQERIMQLEKQKLAMEQEMDSMLKRNCTEEEMSKFLEQFKELYADYGNQRRREVQFHLQQLESLLLPTQTTKMTLWTLEQDESFFKDNHKTSLNTILSTSLGISQEQKMKIHSRRERIKELVKHLKTSLGLLAKLKENVETRHSKFDDKMGELQKILNPRQRAKLVLWVTRNEKLLGEVVPGFKTRTFGLEVGNSPRPPWEGPSPGDRDHGQAGGAVSPSTASGFHSKAESSSMGNNAQQQAARTLGSGSQGGGGGSGVNGNNANGGRSVMTTLPPFSPAAHGPVVIGAQRVKDEVL